MEFMQAIIKAFFEDIGNFIKFKRVLGIDIGTASVKLVEVQRKGERLALEGYGLLETKEYLERGNAAIQTTSLRMVEGDVARYLKTLCHETGTVATHAVASAPLSSVFMVSVEMPLLSLEETGRSVPYQARQYIPLPPSAVSLDWTKVEEFENERGGRSQRLMITAIPKELLNRYRSMFKLAGLRLTAVEVDIQSIVRAVSSPTDPITLLVDIGALSTSIAVVERGRIMQVGQTDYGSATLSYAIARSLGVSTWRADELKRRRGLLGFGGEYELSTSLLPFLDVILQECGHVRDSFERSHGRVVEQLLMVGGGANMPGIQDYTSAQLKLTSREPNALRHFEYPLELASVAKLLNREFAAAAGLALRAKL